MLNETFQRGDQKCVFNENESFYLMQQFQKFEKPFQSSFFNLCMQIVLLVVAILQECCCYLRQKQLSVLIEQIRQIGPKLLIWQNP